MPTTFLALFSVILSQSSSGKIPVSATVVNGADDKPSVTFVTAISYETGKPVSTRTLGCEGGYCPRVAGVTFCDESGSERMEYVIVY